VARVQRQAEVEEIAEGVPVMKNEKEKIDLLFEKNANEQLAGIDWGKFNGAISSRLDEADLSKTSRSKLPTVFKIASGVAAAAAVVFVAMMLRTENPAKMPLENSGHAVVEFIEARGSASVEIIDRNGEGKENGSQAAWIIIRMPEPVLVADPFLQEADNGANGYLRDLIHLF